jgi:D-tyrosyl-tRNA(Tyr) deacylase
MIALVQVVKNAQCVVNDTKISEIRNGMLIYLGVGNEDGINDEIYLSKKISKLRIFPDREGKINQSITDIEGDIMVISNFTLFGDTAKNNRPSFINAADYDTGLVYYEGFCNALEKLTGLEIKRGVFGSDMEINAVQSGPTNLIINTKGKHYN